MQVTHWYHSVIQLIVNSAALLLSLSQNEPTTHFFQPNHVIIDYITVTLVLAVNFK